MDWMIVTGAALGALAVSGAGTPMTLGLLRRRAIFDHPNPRSSHTAPTPRGGGIAVVAALILAWVLLGAAAPATSAGLWFALGLGAGLALVSWIDDLKSLSPGPRLLAQVIAVGATLQAFGPDELVFQGLLPLAVDRLIAGLLWLWFINLFNFMDGIDGLAGAETVAIGLGVLTVALIGQGAGELGPFGLVLAAAMLGFLPLNWQPAKIFLGDVGSVPLGFFAGWLLLMLAAHGQWAAALTLPAYYLADASTTLGLRISQGKPFWRAHREHAYQRAVQLGRSHAAVSASVGLVNLALIGLAAASLSPGAARWASLAGAAVLTLAFLWYLRRPTTRPIHGT